MLGVVLWSCENDHKAVIWCEDHGDLAFYEGGGESVFEGSGLGAGDLIRFKLSEGMNMRVATDPQLVAEQHYPDLAKNLTSTCGTPSRERSVSSGAKNSTIEWGQVLPFKARDRSKRMAS